MKKSKPVKWQCYSKLDFETNFIDEGKHQPCFTVCASVWVRVWGCVCGSPSLSQNELKWNFQY